jgi:RNA polymerase sigma-70 factor (ECF subfamily)
VDPEPADRVDPEDPRDDRALITAHLAGEHEAFGVLVRRHRDRLWAVALRTTGDPEEAADALQDALVNAFRKASGYRQEAAVTTWLHRIVVNACLDRLRRRSVRSVVPMPEHETAETGSRLQEPPAGPERAVELTERRRRLHAALQQIPAEQRAALVLVDMEGRPVDEVAEILGVPPGTVKSRCARGRARLAPLLADLREGNRSAPDRVQPEEGRSVP